jgi:DNA-binding transcriptional ArsR family regulator
MGKAQEDKLLNNLSRDERQIISGFPNPARGKILAKLADGYRISECSNSEVEVVKSFSYYNIQRGGMMYPV